MAQDAPFIRFAARVLGEVSAISLVPAIAAVAISRFVHYRPATILFFGLAFALTSVGLVVRVRQYGRTYARLLRDQKNPPTPPDRV